jgi:DNA-3-methyladenine glycosylase I
LTILRKRENFRAAFANFDVEQIAAFGTDDIERLMHDAGIVRNRAKIEATLNNARRCIALREEFGSLARYVWTFETDARARPAVLDHAALMQIRTSPEAVALSKDLRRRGWLFLGPTTVYSFMEAMGLVNDHLDACDVRGEVQRERDAFLKLKLT